MMATTTHLCSFSGALGALPRKHHGDDLEVLRVLAASPRFTCWDVSSGKLAHTLDRLKRRGWIEYDESAPYPWARAVVTDAGLEAMAAL